jgi:hypothetical protein
MQEMHKGKLYICYKGAPTHQLKKSNKHQAPPANEWKLLDLGVWWKYRLVGYVWVHGSKLSSLSQHCLSENDTSLLCAWFWNGAIGSTTRNYLICDAFSTMFSENVTNVHCSTKHCDDFFNSSPFYDVFLFSSRMCIEAQNTVSIC